MKQFIFILTMLTGLLACQQTPMPQQILPLELQISTDQIGQTRIQPRLGSVREGAVSFTGLPLVSTQNDGAYDYIQAQFTITNNSATAFDNLTLYAVAKNGNLGGTAIKSINLFGGVADISERTRLAKLVVPMHGVNVGTSGLTLIAGREDFQAFEKSEQAELQTALNNNAGGFSSSDKALSYGYVARRCLPDCTTPSGFARDLPPFGTLGHDKGLITIALRIPRSTGTAYSFVMTFAVVNRVSKTVTRSVFPPETVAAASARLSAFGGGSTDQIMQVGMFPQPVSNHVPKHNTDLELSDARASFGALGLGRVATGASHTCALNAVGKAYCWGSNDYGQLGVSDTNPRLVPTPVSGELRFSSLAAGGQDAFSGNTCGIGFNGELYCWGWNGNGELGLGDLIQRTVPTRVKVGVRFSSLSVGSAHTCGLSTTGQAYCWGSNVNGNLGIDNLINQNLPTQVAGERQFVQIEAGYDFTCAIDLAADAYCWGNNSHGQLGSGNLTYYPTPNLVTGGVKFSSISAGNLHSCGISTAGQAYCWGANGQGQLGSSTPQNTTPTLVQGNAVYTAVMAAEFHSCGITIAGIINCWGYNLEGQLGRGNNTDSNLPSPVTPSGLVFANLQSSNNHACAITTSGLLYCWGLNSSGQLGVNDTADRNQPTRDATLGFGL
jgi:alpha-tubulin suppressor-like RCC1 family protein